MPFDTAFFTILAAVGARQPLALFALQLTHLQVHGLRDLAPAHVLRALVEHGGQRALELLRRRVGDALLLELCPREEQRVVHAAVTHLAGRRREDGGGLAVGERDLLAFAQARNERLGIGVRAGELLVLLDQLRLRLCPRRERQRERQARRYDQWNALEHGDSLR